MGQGQGHAVGCAPQVTCRSHSTLLDTSHVARHKLMAEVRERHVQEHLEQRFQAELPGGPGRGTRRKAPCTCEKPDSGQLFLPEGSVALGALTVCLSSRNRHHLSNPRVPCPPHEPRAHSVPSAEWPMSVPPTLGTTGKNRGTVPRPRKAPFQAQVSGTSTSMGLRDHHPSPIPEHSYHPSVLPAPPPSSQQPRLRFLSPWICRSWTCHMHVAK